MYNIYSPVQSKLDPPPPGRARESSEHQPQREPCEEGCECVVCMYTYGVVGRTTPCVRTNSMSHSGLSTTRTTTTTTNRTLQNSILRTEYSIPSAQLHFPSFFGARDYTVEFPAISLLMGLLHSTDTGIHYSGGIGRLSVHRKNRRYQSPPFDWKVLQDCKQENKNYKVNQGINSLRGPVVVAHYK